MKKNLTNVEVILIFGTIIKVFGLIYKILLTRILTIEGMRIMSLIFPTLSLVLCLSSLSISTVVNQNVAAKLNNSRTILKSAFNITFVSSSIICIILLLSFPIYKIIYDNSFIYYPLLICIPLVYLSNTSGILKGYLEANNKFKTTYYSNFFEQIAKFIFTFSMLLIFKKQSVEFKIFMCFLAMMLSEVVSFTYLAIKIAKIKKVNIRQIKTNGYEKNILKQAIPLTIDQLIGTVTGYLEPLIFYYAIGLHNYNMYEASLYYTQVVSYAIPLLIFAHFGVLSIAKFTFPKITKYKDTKTLQDILSKALFLCIVIAIFNLVICCFYAEETLKLLYNDASSANIAKRLAIFFLGTYFNPLFIVILQAYKKEKKLLLTGTICSVIELSLVFVFTYLYSFDGFMYAIIVPNIIRFCLLLYIAQKSVHFKPNKKRLLLTALILGAYFLINYLFTGIITLAISTGFGFLLIGLVYYFYYSNKTAYSHEMKHK